MKTEVNYFFKRNKASPEYKEFENLYMKYFHKAKEKSFQRNFTY